jgi:elongation factor P--beta-lysine ligase
MRYVSASQRATWLAEALNLWAQHQHMVSAEARSQTLVAFRRFCADHDFTDADVAHVQKAQYDLMTYAINWEPMP